MSKFPKDSEILNDIAEASKLGGGSNQARSRTIAQKALIQSILKQTQTLKDLDVTNTKLTRTIFNIGSTLTVVGLVLSFIQIFT